MARCAVWCLLMTLCFFITDLHSEVYSWTDEKGVRHYSDTPVPGQPLQDVKTHAKIWTNSYGMKFVYVEPGTFTMGMYPNKAHFSRFARAHKVTLTRGFQIQVTEVTHEQWRQVMSKNAAAKAPRNATAIQANMPVCRVSGFEAHYFVAELNKLNDGGRYQIPTEAQWEYACRAGKTDEFNWGGDVAYPHLANYKHAKRTKLKPVGSYPPNGWFIYDMHGNVWEWCLENSYQNNAMIDPKPLRMMARESYLTEGGTTGSKGPLREALRLILRGGSYNSTAYKCRSAHRAYRYQLYRGCYFGLRVIRVPED